MNERGYGSAIEFLQRFIAEMHAWQQSSWRSYATKVQKGLMSLNELSDHALQALKAIFEAYVDYKKMPEKVVFTQSYFPEAEKIVDVKEDKDRITVVTDRTKVAPSRRVRYTVLKRKHAYKISTKVEKYDDHKKKFVPWDLLL